MKKSAKKKPDPETVEREPEAPASPVLIAWHPDFSAGRHLQVNITSSLPGPISHEELTVRAGIESDPSAVVIGHELSSSSSCALMGGGCTHGSEIPTSEGPTSRRHLLCQLANGVRLTPHSPAVPSVLNTAGTWCVRFMIDHAGAKSESRLWFRWGNEFDPQLCAVEAP